MQLRILGTHNYESRDTRLASYVIDGVLALDAGSLTRALTFDELKQVRAVILSHRHFDHTRDLLPLGMHARNAGITIDIYGIADTIDFVTTTLLDTRNSPDFTKVPSPEHPAFLFHTVGLYREFQAVDYSAMLVPVDHAVPAAGVQLDDGDTKLFYTGDTGIGVSAVWEHVSPDVLLTEVTFGDENEGTAREVGHLTPGLLGQSLGDFKARHGYLPIVIATHINPMWEEAVRRELRDVSRQLGTEILVADADQTMNL
jgi:3',5'-cyclic-nucleotide phosphodiesterase